MMPDRRKTPQPAIDRSSLPVYQAAASEARFFHTCRLPQCRRARRCIGWHPEDARGPDVVDLMLPPCVTDEASFRRMGQALDEFNRYIQAAFAADCDSDDTRDGDEDSDDGADVWPFPVVVIPRHRRSRHGGRR